MSTIFSIYVCRNFLICFGWVFITLIGLIFIVDLLELLRRISTNEGVGIGLIFRMSLMKLPYVGQQVFPFAVLFGSMISFRRMTLSSELIVARASGLSAWQFLFPVLCTAMVLGFFKISLLSPLGSAMLSEFERLNATKIKGLSSTLKISDSGLWLRQAYKKNQSVIHSTKLRLSGNIIKLEDVTVFVYEGKNKYSQRISAQKADLEDGFWYLQNAWIHKRNSDLPQFQKEMWLPTDITLEKVHDSFAQPETLSFWDLPDFIEDLDKAGFSALRHRLYWHSLLATPLLLIAMVLIAATFTIKQSIRTNSGYLVIGGVLTGFILYFISDLITALGFRQSIPIVLAAWAPSGICFLLGLAMVFHLEDG